MKYILKASTKGFIIVLDNDEMIITPDYTKATQYSTIGDAMKAAVKANDALGTHLVRAVSFN